MKFYEMPLPLLRRCCGLFSLEVGCYILGVTSTVLCLTDLVAGAWNLPRNAERKPEDNLISMSMVMFSTLSAISNIIGLLGIYLRRPGFLQLSLLFNSVFIVCLFLVAIVTCLFSPELSTHLQSPWNVALIVILLVVGVLYSLYYLTMVNSLYRQMKNAYCDSAIPV